MAKIWLACGVGVLLAAPSMARAGDAARADQLFQEALALSDAGNWDAACPKFLASNAEDRSVGALLNLATCAERAGKLLDARALYTEAGALNDSAPDGPRKDAVRAQVQGAAASLEERIPRIVVTTAPADAAISVDGRASAASAPLLVDPGAHVVGATAPGYEPAEERLVLAERDRREVTLTLARRPSTPRVVRPVPPEGSRSTEATSRPSLIAGIVLLSGGVLVGGAGAALLGLTASTVQEVRELCGEDARPPACAGTPADAARATDISAEAKNLEIAGGVLSGVGAASVATGIAVLIAGYAADPEPSTSVGLHLAPGALAWTLTTTF